MKKISITIVSLLFLLPTISFAGAKEQSKTNTQIQKIGGAVVSQTSNTTLPIAKQTTQQQQRHESSVQSHTDPCGLMVLSIGLVTFTCIVDIAIPTILGW